MCVYPAGCVSIVCVSRFKHYSYLRIFSLKKRLIFSPKIFPNRDPFLRFFLPQKCLISQFPRNFCEMGPSSPYASTCEYPRSRKFWPQNRTDWHMNRPFFRGKLVKFSKFEPKWKLVRFSMI